MLADGFSYDLSQYKVLVHQATNTIQCWSEVRAGPEWSPQPGSQDDWVVQNPDSNQGTPLAPKPFPCECFTGTLPKKSGPPFLLAAWWGRNTLFMCLLESWKKTFVLSLHFASFDCLTTYGTVSFADFSKPYASSHLIGWFVQKWDWD